MAMVTVHRKLYTYEMARFDITLLSPQERLELIGELWDSLDVGNVPLTSAQAAEIDRRRASLDADILKAHDARELVDELRRRLS